LFELGASFIAAACGGFPVLFSSTLFLVSRCVTAAQLQPNPARRAVMHPQVQYRITQATSTTPKFSGAVFRVFAMPLNFGGVVS